MADRFLPFVWAREFRADLMAIIGGPKDSERVGPLGPAIPAQAKKDDKPEWLPVPGRPGIERHARTGQMRTNIAANQAAK